MGVIMKAYERIFVGWLVVSGGATGLMLGVIALELIQPGHPLYRQCHLFLRGLLGW